jgi:hypothetical protein
MLKTLRITGAVLDNRIQSRHAVTVSGLDEICPKLETTKKSLARPAQQVDLLRRQHKMQQICRFSIHLRKLRFTNSATQVV